MFVVVQTGVYRHNVYGVFETQEEAVRAAEVICAAEEDDYHRFEVLGSDKPNPEMNTLCTLSRKDHKKWVPDEPLVKGMARGGHWEKISEPTFTWKAA